jgi:hypothetical protein
VRARWLTFINTKFKVLKMMVNIIQLLIFFVVICSFNSYGQTIVLHKNGSPVEVYTYDELKKISFDSTGYLFYFKDGKTITHGYGILSKFTFEDMTTDLSRDINHMPELYPRNNVMIYPNPANEYTSLKFHLDKSENTWISIYTSDGVLVKSIDGGILTSGEQNLRINLNEYSTGIYFVRIYGYSFNIHSTLYVFK